MSLLGNFHGVKKLGRIRTSLILLLLTSLNSNDLKRI